jgi:carboxypeptidase Q
VYELGTTNYCSYTPGVPQIPTAAITIEDAEMFARMQARGTKIVARLYMEAKTVAPTTSQNVLAEVVGAKNPEEIVLIGGHSDSWDVGQGAM